MTRSKEHKESSHFDTCIRWWAKTTCGKIVRGLWVNRYDESGNERSFVRILTNDDTRPKGVHLSGHALASNDMLSCLPVGQWTELQFN